MKRVLTGLKPSGSLTLGNYIGAIKQMIEYQNVYDSYLFVADLHSITVQQNKEELRKNIKDFLALYIACGIDPEKNTIYLQSDIDYIPCISWILECNTYYGELSRMIQFKEKSKTNNNFTSGLLTYPVLMASDIISVDADYVPVGKDQKQHVELTRDIALRFNNKYGSTFVIPEPIITATGTKIMDLQDPSKKMSKSDGASKGVICLLDSPQLVRKKIMSATTDSDMVVKYDVEKKPGISNLLNIYSSLTNTPIDKIEQKYVGKNYGEFKQDLSDIVAERISIIQSKYNELINSDELEDILNNGAFKVNEIAKQKYKIMKEKVGLGR